jgi:uncharacterized protein (DUF433 family)
MESIEINPQIMMGKPVIKHIKFTVEIILENLAYGYTEGDVFKEDLFYYI